jgi:hypothetical protein
MKQSSLGIMIIFTAFILAESAYGAEIGTNSQQIAGAGPKPRIQADVQSSPEMPLSYEERRAMSIAAGRILHHTNESRGEVALKRKENALTKIDKALNLIAMIKKASPVYQTKIKINAGELKYEDSETVQPLIVTIFDELDRVSILRPIVEAKQASAERKVAAAMPILTDSLLRFTRVYLDVAMAEVYLKAAKQSLEEGESEAADSALLSLQLSVVFEYRDADVSLSAASRNLILARNFLESGQMSGTQLALQDANGALAEYEKIVSGIDAGRVKDLRQHIQTLGGRLQDPKRDAQEIMNLWDQVVAMYQ